jgi:hypothetical protein
MRREAVFALALGLMSLALSVGATETANYEDKFSSIGWGGSDGSLLWSGPWSEIGDDGDEKQGNVRVVSSGNCASGNCLHVTALTTLLGPIGAVRAADTSALAEASLTFDIKTTASLVASDLEIQVNGGGEWVTVAEYEWGSAFTDHPTIDVSGFGSEDFRVRVRFTGALLGGEAFIDNVEVRGRLVEEPTTTTSVPETTTTTTTTTTTPSTTSSTSTSTIAAATATSTTTATEGPGGDRGTTIPGRTTSSTATIEQVLVGPDSGGDRTAPDGSGIRAAGRGLQANFQGDLYGEVRTVSSLSAVDFQADYNMAVEVVRASWGWMVLLGLVVAYSIISGLERRRSDLDS